MKKIKTYTVICRQAGYGQVDVQATSPAEALEKATQEDKDGNIFYGDQEMETVDVHIKKGAK